MSIDNVGLAMMMQVVNEAKMQSKIELKMVVEQEGECVDMR